MTVLQTAHCFHCGKDMQYRKDDGSPAAWTHVDADGVPTVEDHNGCPYRINPENWR